jgi:hypothetical protein
MAKDDGRATPEPGTNLGVRRPLAVALLVLAGCAGDNRVATTFDPLLGGPPLRPAGPAARPPAQTAGPPPAAGSLPPSSPAPFSPASNAALAAGAPRPSGTGNELRIGSPDGSWAGQGPAAAGEASGAVLRRPQPVIEPVGQRSPAAGAGPSESGAPLTTYEQAQAQLAARGVVWQRQERNADTGEWKFSCAIPNRQNPNLRRMYEARAADYLSAIRAVLEQIDREQ